MDHSKHKKPSGWKKSKSYKEPAGSDKLRAHAKNQSLRKKVGLPYGEHQERLKQISKDIGDRAARRKGFGSYKEWTSSSEYKKMDDARWANIEKGRKTQIKKNKSANRKRKASKFVRKAATTAIRGAGPLGIAVSIFDFLKGKPAY